MKLDFVYVGPDKAGSTWLYHRLREHDQVLVPRIKELFYFDSNFTRGDAWLESHYRRRRDGILLGELSHEYLYSTDALSRLRRHSPNAKVIVSLRDPVDRAYSSYRYMKAQGRVARGLPFEAAVQQIPELLQHGQYGYHLRNLMTIFPRDSLIDLVFDDLQVQPQRYYNELCDGLGIQRVELSSDAALPVLEARAARSPILVARLRSIAAAMRGSRLHSLVQRAKDSGWMNRVLFTHEASPPPSKQTVQRLRSQLGDDVRAAGALVDRDLCSIWGWNRIG